MFKKFLLFLIILMLLLTNIFGGVICANTNYPSSDLNDIDNHWAKDQINSYVEKNFLNGYKDNTFKPNNYIKRAEFIKIINNVFGFAEKNNIEFTDVTVQDWFYNEVAKANFVGYIKGNSDGTIKPNSYITREQAAAIIARLHDLDKENSGNELEFTDKDDISDWAVNSIKAISNKGYIKGYDDGSFKPLNNITRAEAVVLINRVAGNIYNNSGEYGKDEDVKTVDGNVTISKTGVSLSNIHIKGDLYVTEGIGDGEVCLDNVTVDGKTIIKGGGPNSIVIINSGLNIVIVNTITGDTRVVAKGNTNINNIVLNSGSKLEEDGLTGTGFGQCTINVPENEEVILIGNFDNVKINTPNNNINIPSGNIENLNISEQAEGANIEIGQDVSIENVNINASTKISGQGEIENVEINTEDVVIEQQVNDIVLGDDVEQAVINGETYPKETSSSSGRRIKAPTVSGVENNYYYNIDVAPTYNKGTATIAKDGGEAQEFISGTLISEEGSYVLVAKYSTKSTIVNFTIDKTAPEISGATNNQYYNTNVIPTFTEGTAILTKDGGEAQAFVSETETSEEGSYVLVVIDEAQNSTTVNFTIDKTAPDAPVIETTLQTVNSETINIEGTAEAGATITITGGKETEAGTVDEQGNFTVLVSLTQDEVNTLNVTATDAANNESETATVKITEDSTPPEAPVISIEPEILTNGAVTVTITAEENAAIYYKKTEDSEYTAYNAPFQVSQNTTVSAYAVDLYDNQGNSSKIYIDNIDTTAPVITINGNESVTTEALEAYVDLGATAIDNVAGEVEVTSTSSVNTSVVGTYSVTYTAVDTVGNTATATRIVNVVDTTPPNVPIIETTSQTVNAESINIEGTAEAGAAITITGGKETEAGTVDEQGNFTVLVSLTQDKVNTLNVTATDAATNESGTATVKITEDSTPPEAPVISIEPETLTNGAVTVTITAEENAAIYYKKTEDSEYTAYNAPFQISQNTTVSAYAVDLYDNEGSIGELYVSNIDTTPPNVPVIITTPQIVNAESINIEGTAEVGAVITITGGKETEAGTVDKQGYFTVSVSLKQDDVNTLNVTATDAATNESGTATVEITEDSTPPEAPVISIEPETLTNGAVTVTITAEEDAIIHYIKAEDSDYSTYNQPFEVNHNTTVSAYAVDLYDNQGSIGELYISNIDTTPPTAPVITTTSQTVNAESINIEGTAEVGAVITITGGKEKATGTVDEQGNFTVAVSLKQDDVNTLNVTATDAATNESDATTVKITENTAPIANGINIVTDEDIAKNGTLTGSDVENSDLSFSKVVGPSNGTVTVNADGTYTYEPALNYNGQDSFTFKVNDGLEYSEVATVIITVYAINDAPVANNDIATVDEDNEVTINVLTNDSDVDGDTLNITLVSDASNGTTEIINNQIKYMPSVNFNGNDSFTYTINDGNEGTDIAAVTITVNPINDAPVANDDTATVDEDSNVLISVLTNDTDVENDTITIEEFEQGANGTVALEDSSLRYTPNANYNGTDSFTYTISDGNGGTALGTVNVIINPVNDAPVAENDIVTVDEDGTVLIDVLENDSDVDGDTLNITLVSDASNGTTEIINNQIKYMPSVNFNGNDSFTYTINDGNGGTDSATVTITVNPVNDVPIASEDSVTVDEDETVLIDVLDNDSDIDGDVLSITGFTGTSIENGKVEQAEGGLRYTPYADFNGTDSFTYGISDGNGGTAIGTVNVTVNPVNDAPVAENDIVTVDEDETVFIDVLENDSDVDGDAISIYGYTPKTNHGTVEVIYKDNLIKYTPDKDYNWNYKDKVDIIFYTIRDKYMEEDGAIVTVKVNPVNDAPVVAEGQGTQTGNAAPASNDGLTEAVAYTANIIDWFEDVDIKDTLTYEVVSAVDNSVTPNNVSSNVNISGAEITYTPQSEQAEKTVTIIVKANDGTVDSTSNVTITVTVGAVPADVPPTLSSVETSEIVPNTVEATSNKDGTLYLVDKNESYVNVANLENALMDNCGRKVNCTANTVASIPTDGLPSGIYIVYAVDSSNNMSEPSGDITITNPDVTPPILSEVKAKTGDYTILLVTSNEEGNLFIVDKSQSVNYNNYAAEDDFYDAIGAGYGLEEGPVIANQPYEINVSNLANGTYLVYAQDSAENISSSSQDVIVNNGEADLLSTASPTIAGTEQVGETLTASSGYNDVDGDIEEGTTFAFYRYDSDGVSNETEVQSASTTNTYILQSEDEGKVIKVKVVPMNARGTGLEVESNATGIIAAESSSDTTPPTVSFNIEDGATGVPLDQQIIITFNEPVRNLDDNELNNDDLMEPNDFITVTVLEDIPFNIAYTATINDKKTQITVIPDDNETGQLIPSTGYQVTMKKVEDASDNQIVNTSITFETVQPSISWSTTTLSESSNNDGSIDDVIILTLTNDEFNDNITNEISTNESLPKGLDVILTKVNANTSTISFTGNAISHENINDVTDLEIYIDNDAFVNSDAMDIINSSMAEISINFNDVEAPTVPSTMGVNVEFGSIEIEMEIEDDQNNPIKWSDIANSVDMDNSTIVISISEGDEDAITIHFNQLGGRVNAVNNIITFTGEPGLNGYQTGDFAPLGLLEGFVPYGHNTVTVNIVGDTWNVSASGTIPYLDTIPTKGVDNTLDINVEYELAYETENGTLNLTALPDNSIDLTTAVNFDYQIALENKVQIASINGTDEYLYVYAMLHMPLENVTSLTMTYNSNGDKFNISATRLEETMVDSIMTLFFLDGSTGTIQNINLDLFGEETGTDVEVDYLPMIDDIGDGGASIITVSFDTPMNKLTVENIANYQYTSSNGTNIENITYSIEDEEAVITLSSNVADGDELIINITEEIIDSNGFELMQSAFKRNNSVWEENMMVEPTGQLTVPEELTLCDDGALEWNTVDNAQGYKIWLYKDEGLLAEYPKTEGNMSNCIDLSSDIQGVVGTYKAKIQALGDGGNITDSDISNYSNSISVVQLATPTELTWDGNFSKWNGNVGERYTVRLYKNDTLFSTITGTGTEQTPITDGTSGVDLTDNMWEETTYKFTVQAEPLDGVITGISSAESELSTGVTVSQLAQVNSKNITVNPETADISWSAVENASGYAVFLNGTDQDSNNVTTGTKFIGNVITTNVLDLITNPTLGDKVNHLAYIYATGGNIIENEGVYSLYIDGMSSCSSDLIYTRNLATPTTDEMNWDGYTATFPDVNEENVAGTGAPYTYEIELYQNYQYVKTVDAVISEGLATYDFSNEIAEYGAVSYYYRVKAKSTWDTIIDSAFSENSNSIKVTSSQLDAEAVNTAKSILAEKNTLEPKEGTDTNVVTMAQALVDAGVNGVTVTLYQTGNTQIITNGDITYGNEVVSADVIFTLTKNETASNQTMTVVVPATTNLAPTATNVTIDYDGEYPVGANLLGSYTYNDSEGDIEGISLYKWYRGVSQDGTDKSVITGATNGIYTMTSDDLGKYLFFEVTPVAKTGTTPGESVVSSGVGPVVEPTAASINPTNVNYNINDPKDVSTIVTFNDATAINSIKNGSNHLTSNDFEFNNGKLTIKQSYIGGLNVEAGNSIAITISFDVGDSKALIIDVIE